MHVVKKVETEKEYRICDRCARVLDPEAHDIEFAESVSVSFRAGFGSVFDDGSFIHADFCQQCLKDVLGKYLKVLEEDPLASQRPAPRRVYQPYQMDARLERDELDWAVAQLFEKIEKEVARQLEVRRRTPAEISRSIANLRDQLTVVSGENPQ